MEFSFVIREGQVASPDLCAEILTSSNPPLTTACSTTIDEIYEQVMGELTSSDCWITESLFGITKSLPPIAGELIVDFLNAMKEFDGGLESVVEFLRDGIASDDSTDPELVPNELGFVTRDVKSLFQYPDGEKAPAPTEQVHFDILRVQRESTESLVKIVALLSCISTQPARIKVVDALSQVFHSRVQFDLKDSPSSE